MSSPKSIAVHILVLENVTNESVGTIKNDRLNIVFCRYLCKDAESHRYRRKD